MFKKRVGSSKEKQERGILGAKGGECFQKREVGNLLPTPSHVHITTVVFTCHIGKDLFISVFNNNT